MANLTYRIFVAYLSLKFWRFHEFWRFFRNPTDGQWYSFDDMHTSKVEEAEVVSNNAYILFYQKQIKGGGQSSSSSSSSSSTTSSSQEHWVYRMPDFNYKHKLTKAQQQQQNLKAVTTGSATVKKTVPETKPEVKPEVVTETKSEEPAKADIKNEDAEEEIPPPVDKNDVD